MKSVYHFSVEEQLKFDY